MRRLSISETLRRAIEAYPASLCELGRQSGVDKAALSRFLRGGDLKIVSVERLAGLFKLELRPAGPDKTKGQSKAATRGRKGK